MNLCTHFSFLYCQCVLLTSREWLQEASFGFFSNFAVQLSHLMYSSFFWFVPRWCTLLSEIKFPSFLKILFFKSGYKPLSLLLTCCSLAHTVTLSILCHFSLTNWVYKCSAQADEDGATNSDLSSFACCRLWAWVSLLILLFRYLGTRNIPLAFLIPAFSV